jgi:hypothetical protein
MHGHRALSVTKKSKTDHTPLQEENEQLLLPSAPSSSCPRGTRSHTFTHGITNAFFHKCHSRVIVNTTYQTPA